MTENGHDIQNLSTKRTDFHVDRVLLFGQVKEEKEKAHPKFIPNYSEHFFKFLLTSRTNGTFGFSQNTSRPFAKPNEQFFTNTHKTVNSLKIQ